MTKAFLDPKLLRQLFFGSKKIWGPEKSLGPKSVGIKIFWAPKRLRSNRMLIQKKSRPPKYWLEKIWVSNNWDIPNMDKCRQDKCCLDKCGHDVSVEDTPRNLPLKFGKYRTSNSYNIAGIGFCGWGGSMQSHFHVQPLNTVQVTLWLSLSCDKNLGPNIFGSKFFLVS